MTADQQREFLVHVVGIVRGEFKNTRLGIIKVFSVAGQAPDNSEAAPASEEPATEEHYVLSALLLDDTGNVLRTRPLALIVDPQEFIKHYMPAPPTPADIEEMQRASRKILLPSDLIGQISMG